MDIYIKEMKQEYAQQISQWRYGGIYSMYDCNESDIAELMDGTHFACTNAVSELIGYFCYGNGARIPTLEENIYDEKYLDIGLGLRPDLCGKGHGLTFFLKGIDHAQRHFNTQNFRLSVATFNERAIKLYSKAGFYVEREVTHSFSNNKFLVMKYAG